MSTPNPKAGFPERGRCRVLIADDDRDSALSLSMLLQLEGHQVFTAFTGSEALEVADKEQPEVLIVDIGMPVLNGYEVARYVRQTAWGRHVKLIAASGHGQARDVVDAKAAGFDHHLIKPVEPETVYQMVSC